MDVIMDPKDLRILLPMIRKIAPAVIAQDIVYVEPMTRPDESKTWQDYFYYLVQRGYIFKTTKERYEEYITRKMQEKYPGPYVVIEFQYSNKTTFDMIFDSPQEELLWKIKQTN